MVDPELDQAIHEFIAAESGVATEAAFTELALRLFAYQFAHNAPYRKYCQRRDVTPEQITDWRAIPAVPTSAFKTVRLATFPEAEEIAVFQTSGTSSMTNPGRIHTDQTGLDFLVQAICRTSTEYVYVDQPIEQALILMAPPAQMPHAAIAYGMDKVTDPPRARCKQYLFHDGAIDLPAFVRALRESEASGAPTALYGASFGFVHVMDALRRQGVRFQLPAGSFAHHGGGFKGRSRTLTPEEMIADLSDVFGLAPSHCLNVLALTEVQAFYPDNSLRNHVLGRTAPRAKVDSHFTRTVVVDPETLEILPAGATGLLRYISLANRSTVLAVQSDDLGQRTAEGFEIFGRVPGSEARGCSLAMDELLSALEA